MSSAITVELFSTLERAHSATKAAAEQAGDRSTLGIRRLTPHAFVEELWMLWGDGRKIVGKIERSAILSQLLSGQDCFSSAPGATALLGKFIGSFAGSLSRFNGSHTLLTSQEQMAIDLGKRYLSTMAEKGWVELDEAATLLEQRVVQGEIPPCPITFKDSLKPTCGVTALLETLAQQRLVDCSPDFSFSIPPLKATVVPRLLTAAGPAARAKLIRDCILNALEQNAQSVLVCGPDALTLFQQLSGGLTTASIPCALRCTCLLEQTYAGRLWRAALQTNAGYHSLISATDAALNPLSGIFSGDARSMNEAWRKDRLTKSDTMEKQLAESSELFASILSVVSSTDPPTVHDFSLLSEKLSEAIEATDNLDANKRRREKAAAAKLGAIAKQVEAVGGDPDIVPDLWLKDTLAIEEITLQRSSDILVEFASSGQLLSLSPESFDVVILTDLSDSGFRAPQSLSSLDELATKLGWGCPQTPFDDQRRLFTKAEQAARKQFVCVFTQRTSEAEEAYPSFLLSEYKEALRNEGIDLDNFTVHGGEDDLVSSVGDSFSPVENTLFLPAIQRGKLHSLHLPDFITTIIEEGRKIPVLSPSAIERYLACPYSWFIMNRITPQSIDEQFDFREEGSFVHRVLKRFYEHLAKEGRSRVGEVSWKKDEATLRTAFKEQVKAEKLLQPLSGRLVATSSAEGLRLLRIYRSVRESLKLQGRFAPGFTVHDHEISFSLDDHIKYAGINLRGRADRLDINEELGRFLVVDYKGSVSSGYNLKTKNSESIDLPEHIQTLIYAQAFRQRLSNLHCAGALYISYRAHKDKELAAGALDAVYFSDDPLIKSTSLAPLAFDDFLDYVEASIAKELQRLSSGDIKQHPRFAAACRYCPVPECPRRLS